MDIKKAIQRVIDEAKCEIDAEWEGDESAIGLRKRRAASMLDSIDRWADMANAAIALAEYQATSGYDPEVDRSTYVRQRGELWDAFIMARAKVKGDEQ